MATIFLIHGAYGNPNENRFPRLKYNLEQQGHTIFIPQFPTPENQTLNNWKAVFKTYEKHIDENTIFVGHSLGVPFILEILEKLDIEIYASFFVAGLIGNIGIPEFDKINATFIDKKFNWDCIKQHCSYFEIFHADNDPYVPLIQGKEIAKEVGVSLQIIKNAGHFNEQAGYTDFPLLLEKINSLI